MGPFSFSPKLKLGSCLWTLWVLIQIHSMNCCKNYKFYDIFIRSKVQSYAKNLLFKRAICSPSKIRTLFFIAPPGSIIPSFSSSLNFLSKQNWITSRPIQGTIIKEEVERFLLILYLHWNRFRCKYFLRFYFIHERRKYFHHRKRACSLSVQRLSMFI